MPRDGSQTYQAPFPDVVEGTTIESTVYNGFVNDIVIDLNTPRPVKYGGTGADNPADAMQNLGGELSKQLVTNYDSHPFQAGSFYSAASASGAPTGNAFTGICYVAVIAGVATTDMFLEARDQVTTQVYVRQKKANVWQPWVSGTAVVGGTTPPTAAADNTMWWDPTRGKLFVLYNDTTGSPSRQWVEAVAVPDIDPNTFVTRAGDTMTGPLVVPSPPTDPLHAASKAYVDAGDAAIVARPPVLRGYIDGLRLTTSSASSTFGITPGVATDSATQIAMVLPSTLSKTTGPWSVGNGGGTFTVGGVAANTWYYVFLIYRSDTGVVDVMVASVVTAASILPAGYTHWRRIGAMKTDASSNWTQFTQFGDEFMWLGPPMDINTATLGTTATPFQLSVPTGIQCFAIVRGRASHATANTGLLLSSLDENATAAAGLQGNITVYIPTAAGNTGLGIAHIRVTIGGQIRAVASTTSMALNLTTIGWIDLRGKDA